MIQKNYLTQLKKKRGKAHIGWDDLVEENKHYEDVLYAMSGRCTYLTEMQAAVCTLVRAGFTSAQIAEVFSIKEESVSFHRKNARQAFIKANLCKPTCRLDAFLRSLTLPISQN